MEPDIQHIPGKLNDEADALAVGRVQKISMLFYPIRPGENFLLCSMDSADASSDLSI